MKDLSEALALVLDGVEPLAAEDVPIGEALGRVAAAPVPSVVDLPPFDRSAMDGYAVRAADVAPGVPLRVLGDAAAGGAAPVAVRRRPRGRVPPLRRRPARLRALRRDQ